MESAAEESQGRVMTVMAVLVAIVTVLGAYVAWRSSVVEDASGDADFAGLRALLNTEETRALNNVNAYEDYRAFTSYQLSSLQGDLIAVDMESAGEDEVDVLDAQRAQAHDLAIAQQSTFPNRFLNRDGTYGVQRQLGEMWADAAKDRDLNAEPQFAEADKLRSRANVLLLWVTVMGLGLVVYTVVESVTDKLRWPLVGLASVLSFGGFVAAMLVQSGH